MCTRCRRNVDRAGNLAELRELPAGHVYRQTIEDFVNESPLISPLGKQSDKQTAVARTKFPGTGKNKRPPSWIRWSVILRRLERSSKGILKFVIRSRVNWKSPFPKTIEEIVQVDGSIFIFLLSLSLSLSRDFVFRWIIHWKWGERKGREKWPVNTFIGSLSERNSCVSRCGEKRRSVGESRFKPEAPVIGEDWGASVSRCSKYNVARQSSREGRVARQCEERDLGRRSCSNSLPRSRTVHCRLN